MNTQEKPTNKEPKRLPCRGCLPSCKNFDSCKGKPWRTALLQDTTRFSKKENVPV